MKTSIIIRRILSDILSATGVVKTKLKKLGKKGSLILMYHRILPSELIDRTIQPGMYVEPGTFERHLKFLQKEFHLSHLSDIFNEGKNDTSYSKPRCAITFDDGWYDFYEYAFPVIQRYQAPVTVFLPTEYIGTNDWFWTDRLGSLFLKKEISRNEKTVKSQVSNEIVAEIEGYSDRFEARLEASIEILKKYKRNIIDKTINDLAMNWGIDSYNNPGRSFLSWQEVNEMAKSGLVHYGSHTASHPILTTLDESEVVDELVRSKTKLVELGLAKEEFIPFCYPNGGYDQNIIKIVRKTGYHVAFTTKKGWCEQNYNPFAIKRVGVHQDITSSQSMLGYWIVS